jgi:hypothetical protein
MAVCLVASIPLPFLLIAVLDLPAAKELPRRRARFLRRFNQLSCNEFSSAGNDLPFQFAERIET